MSIKSDFTPANLSRTYRDPIALAVLAVDLFPIVAVIQFGWGAVALVFLYWLENLVIGIYALARMGTASLKDGWFGGLTMLFIGPFFVVHYGMFCFVHGIFLTVYASFAGYGSAGFEEPVGLVKLALGSGAHMTVFVGAIIVLQGIIFVRDYLMRGEWRDTDVMKEMAKPYTRIVVLHIGLFVGAAALLMLGQPMIGVLALIFIRALWGMYLTVRRRLQLDGEAANEGDAPSSLSGA